MQKSANCSNCIQHRFYACLQCCLICIIPVVNQVLKQWRQCMQINSAISECNPFSVNPPMCFILSCIECKVELRCRRATDCRADRSFSLGVTGLWDVELWSVFCVKSHKTFCQWPGSLRECHAIAVYWQFICRNMEQEYQLVRKYSSACALHMYHYEEV